MKKLIFYSRSQSILTQMTASNELIVLESKQWICWVKELRMEHNFHSVIDAVEEVATTNPIGGEE